MKTTLLHKQSTSQTPSDNEPTQTLPDPGLTQRIAWTPPNTPPRLNVTPGGGPKPDYRAYRDTLYGAATLLLTLLLLRNLPPPHAPVKTQPVSPPLTTQLAQRPAAKLVFDPLPPPFGYRPDASAPVHVSLVAPSVPIPADD